MSKSSKKEIVGDVVGVFPTNKSPLRYPGGKTRACKVLDKILIENFNMENMTSLISPFFGGGSFEFYIQNKYKIRIIGNDKFIPLASFWSCCKNQKDELCDMLYKVGANTTQEGITKEQFMNYRRIIMSETNILMQAYYYFIINRCSFSGATLSGGFSQQSAIGRFTKSSIDRIKNLDLSATEIHNKDFEDFINTVVPDHAVGESNNYIIFADPPYYLEKKSKLYGNNGDMHDEFDHKKLFSVLSKRKGWLLTYNDCDYVRNLYKDYKIIEVDWTYGMNKSKKSSEIVIIGLCLK